MSMGGNAVSRIRQRLPAVGGILAFALMVFAEEPGSREPDEPGRAEQLQQAFTAAVGKVAPCVVSLAASAGERPATDPLLANFYRAWRPGETDRIGLGSGIVVSPDGLILTSARFVRGGQKVQVTLAEGQNCDGEVIAIHPCMELAAIRVFADEALPFLKLDGSPDVSVGQWVLALGNPLGYAGDPQCTVSAGVASAVHRYVYERLAGDELRLCGDLIQTDATVDPGNNGGPLVNTRGEVIGINVLLLPGADGSSRHGFAIPTKHAARFVAALGRGPVSPGWLGLVVTEEDLEQRDQAGVTVMDVAPDGPAAAAGVQEGDVIVELDGLQTRNLAMLVHLVSAALPGTAVKLKVVREAGAVDLSAVVGQKSGPRPLSERLALCRQGWRGLFVQDLTEELVEQLGLRTDRGALVSKCEEDSSAHEAGIRDGQVIDQVRQGDAIHEIRNVADFVAAVGELAGTITIRADAQYHIVQPESAQEAEDASEADDELDTQ